jgi:hypothetical protein
MKEFGWSIEYTLSLTYPVFISLFGLIRQTRFDATIDEFYTPYAAAKYGGKCHKFLFDGRGEFIINGSKKFAVSDEEITPEMIEEGIVHLRFETEIENAYDRAYTGTQFVDMTLLPLGNS